MPWQLLHPERSAYECELNSEASAFLPPHKIKGQSCCSILVPEKLSRWMSPRYPDIPSHLQTEDHGALLSALQCGHLGGKGHCLGGVRILEIHPAQPRGAARSPAMAVHRGAFSGEWKLQGMCMGTAAGEISSSALPKRQRVLSTMQKIHPASQSSGRLKLPFILTVTRGGSPVYDSSSPVTQKKCHVILFVYSVITRAASLSHARRRVLF